MTGAPFAAFLSAPGRKKPAILLALFVLLCSGAAVAWATITGTSDTFTYTVRRAGSAKTITASSRWTMTPPVSPTNVVHPRAIGLDVDNATGVTYHDYVIDGGGDSSVLLEGTTHGVELNRFTIRRTDANPAVSWPAHGVYVKAYGNTFKNLSLDNAGGHGTSGLSVRMRDNTFTRTRIKGYPFAVTYYEHDGKSGTVTFDDGDWTFSGDAAVWGDDSNDPPRPFIKQRFVFVNIAAHGPAGAAFLRFGDSAYVSGSLAYSGPGVEIVHCTLNGRPVTAADVHGVPSSKLTIS